MNDHACKQLVGVVMDYVIMHWDDWEEAQRIIDADFAHGDRSPVAIESAVMLLRFEKIGRWQSNAWIWENPPDYAPEMIKVAGG